MNEAAGTFEIEMTPEAAEADGSVARMSFTKKWHGALSGSSSGIFLSTGDPESGSAGYVVVEVFHGSLDAQYGGFHFLQLGTMDQGETQLNYVIAPGSGSGELADITGSLELEIVDGEHRYLLRHSL